MCLKCGAHQHSNVTPLPLSDFDRGLYVGSGYALKLLLTSLLTRAEDRETLVLYVKRMIDGIVAGEDG